jgi:hypothetical protein
MDWIPDNARSLALPEFCAAVVNRHASAWPPTEHQLAQEFYAQFGMNRLSFYDGLVNWCGDVGINVSTMELPHGLRGATFWHERNMSIVMPPNGGCFISREHTLLHEVRELLEGMFAHLGYPTCNGAALESRAEQFAASVRIAMFVESSKDFFKLASEVQNPLGRACAYGLVGLVTAASVVGCAGIRQLEAQVEARQASQST